MSVTAMLFWTKLVFLLVALGQVTAECVQGFFPLGSQRKIEVAVPRKPQKWTPMKRLCSRDFDGQRLISLQANLTEKHKQKCGDFLVPVFLQVEIDDVPASGKRDLTKYELNLMDPLYPKMKQGVGALNMTTGLWHFVDDDFLFSCVVCETSLEDDLHGLTAFEDSDFNCEIFQVTLVSHDVQIGEAYISVEEEMGLAEEIKKVIHPPEEPDQDITLRERSLDGKKRLVLIFHLESQYRNVKFDKSGYWDSLEKANGVHDTKWLKKYDMEVKNITGCPEKVTVGQGNSTVVWPVSALGTVLLSWENATGLVSRRVCVYNWTLNRAAWLEQTLWEVVWMPCFPEDQQTNMAYYRGHFNSASQHQQNTQLVTLSFFVCFWALFM